jgi:sugar (pentulose or hexulose) kinase
MEVNAPMVEMLLGIDAGQTVTKAVLFDIDGRQVGIGSAKVVLDNPQPRRVERDMHAVWHATVRAVAGVWAKPAPPAGTCWQSALPATATAFTR